MGDPRGRLITASEVAKVFGVSAKTVARWATQGKLVAFKTLGGHRRFHENDVAKLHVQEGQENG